MKSSFFLLLIGFQYLLFGVLIFPGVESVLSWFMGDWFMFFLFFVFLFALWGSVVPLPLIDLIQTWEIRPTTQNPVAALFGDVVVLGSRSVEVGASLYVVLGVWAILGGLVAIAGARKIRSGKMVGVKIWTMLVVMSIGTVLWNVVWFIRDYYTLLGSNAGYLVSIAAAWAAVYFFLVFNAFRWIKREHE